METCDGGGVDADDFDTEAREVPGDLPLAAADVEHQARTPSVAADQREDLILVLRVGAGGELALPPAGVPLPQRLVVTCPSISWPGLPCARSLRR